MLGTTLGVFFFSGIFLLAPSSVFAQGAGRASTPRLASEYQRLSADLDRVNAEVAALKRGGRSVRTDYLLRDKLAEAEALARKVTDAEARLRTARGPLPPETPAGAVPTPAATPQDGVVELEAKADLLSDQARRFRAEAEALSRTAEQIRSRQALRRRASAWDRDPLAGFEASKRVAVIPTQSSRTTLGNTGESAAGPAATRGPVTPASDVAPKSGGSGVLGIVASESGDSARAGVPVAVPLPVPPPATTPGGVGAVPVVAVGSSPPLAVGPALPTSAATPSTSHPLTAPAPLSTDSASRAAAQQRTLLDPATLAGIRGSLSQAGSLSDPDAVEAAATALRRHAQALDEHARRLRARASQE
jgi:hypothetical protein